MSDALAIALMLIAAACWLTSVINWFLVVMNRKPGLPLFPNWFESPGNYIFRPGSLTDKGLRARRWVFVGVIGFFACIGLGIMLSKMNVIASQ
jgi:hypothetical protein